MYLVRVKVTNSIFHQNIEKALQLDTSVLQIRDQQCNSPKPPGVLSTVHIFRAGTQTNNIHMSRKGRIIHDSLIVYIGGCADGNGLIDSFVDRQRSEARPSSARRMIGAPSGETVAKRKDKEKEEGRHGGRGEVSGKKGSWVPAYYSRAR